MNIDKDEIRRAEAEWLKDRIKRLGLSHLELHNRLVEFGFDGHINNITLWGTERTSIPNEWLIRLIEILEPDNVAQTVVQKYSARMPFLGPYFKDFDEVSASPASRIGKKKTPELYYVVRVGDKAGDRYYPHKNRKGYYQGGKSRFREDIEEFESIEKLWKRMQDDKSFKVRMSPKDKSRPPSLIAQDSIVVDWSE